MRSAWRIISSKLRSKIGSIAMLSFAMLDMLLAVPMAGYIMTKGVENATSTDEKELEKTVFLKITMILPLVFAVLTVLVLIFSNLLQSFITLALRMLTFITLIKLIEDKYIIPIWICTIVGTGQLLLDCIASAVGEHTKRSWKATIKLAAPRIWVMGVATTFLSLIFFLATESIKTFNWIYYTEYVLGWEVLLATSYFWTIHETICSTSTYYDDPGREHGMDNRTEEITQCYGHLDIVPP